MNAECGMWKRNWLHVWFSYFPHSAFQLPPSALYPIDRFKNIAVLNTDAQGHGFSLGLEGLVKVLPININGDIHFVYHNIVAGIIAAFEYRLQVGDIDAIAGNDGADPGHKSFAVRTLGGNNKGFGLAGNQFRFLF